MKKQSDELNPLFTISYGNPMEIPKPQKGDLFDGGRKQLYRHNGTEWENVTEELDRSQ